MNFWDHKAQRAIEFNWIYSDTEFIRQSFDKLNKVQALKFKKMIEFDNFQGFYWKINHIDTKNTYWREGPFSFKFVP